MRGAGALAVLTLALLAAASGCTNTAQEPVVLEVVPAGSLLYPFEHIERAFESEHPGIDVRLEGHGSIQAVRQVTDLHRDVDVVAVADASLIPDMMFRPMEDGEGNYTDTYRTFATNEMVIAYTDRSAYADEITAENWYTILARPDVRVGFSNPMLDACGYRALMVTALAEEHYEAPGIFAAIIGDAFTPSLTMTREDGVRTITLPALLKPSSEKVAIRDGSIYLLSLIDAGGIDYAFEYRSVADEHGLLQIDLPPEIDLSDAAFADTYRSVVVKLGFRRFSSVGDTRVGQPIVYAVTVPATAEHPEEAASFVAFVLDAFTESRDGWPQPLE
ncbi:tungstate ABC transporter substrate-binding protein WtpA [Methanoculleus sp. FWC-SCC1]|uniref:Tungstate ABC transporter substrate-binding protein WtpA n=1 Tax=Methanoculleus frigidifontis TaxID=2584085 RepID=A0ABT8MCD5_9EURY|nr:tungstate ABC transporter substrate-binding protein WtpA [Methanoculleus sp. FWC-SCC1]MDN7025599.1 tungstate ABC transporter substrate-binding protein WtpA [Methanoculleus sp. FWC-SCC1]